MNPQRNRTTIYLPTPHREKLREVTYTRGITMTEAITYALEETYEIKPESNEEGRNAARALDELVQEVQFDGPSDLAQNLDEYMYHGKK